MGRWRGACCPVTTKIAGPRLLTCGEESSLSIHGGHGARFARFKWWPRAPCANEDCPG